MQPSSPKQPPTPPPTPPPSDGQSQPGQEQPYVVEPAQQPERQDADGQPQPHVWVARPLEPEHPVISEESRKRHEHSKMMYPGLNLSDGEFVVSAIKRHPIGLIQIWAAVAVLIILSLFFLPFYSANQETVASMFMTTTESLPSIAVIAMPLLLLDVLFALGGLIASVVYLGNRFFLTNESVIQIIQTSLFHKREQTVSLSNIEDASFLQKGIIQHLLNYGSLRLSTEGDETTYRFNYASNPTKQVAILNNAVEAFKMGRPVDPNLPDEGD